MDMKKASNLDQYEGTYDDDPFYAQLKRQILFLIADDDEEDFLETKHCKPNNDLFSSSLKPSHSFSWLESGNANLNSSRTSNGTGVFIPHVVKSRRRYRPGRINSNRRTRNALVEKDLPPKLINKT